MVFSSMQNKVLVLGAKMEMIYSSQDLLYTDIWTLQGMCLNGKFEWFNIFFNYFSFPVKPGNSNSKFVIGIGLLFLMAKFSWMSSELKLWRYYVPSQCGRHRCEKDCTLGEKDARMQDRTRIWSRASTLLLISYATWVSRDRGHNFHSLFLKDRESFESYSGRLESYLLY